MYPQGENVFISVLWCPLRFLRISNAVFVFIHICLYTEFMFYLCHLYLFTHTGVKHHFDITWCSYYLTVIRRILLVELELKTFPGNMSSPPVCLWGNSCCLIFSFLCSGLLINVCTFVFLLLAIVFPALLRLTASDFPFSIFKKILIINTKQIVKLNGIIHLLPRILWISVLEMMYYFHYQNINCVAHHVNVFCVVCLGSMSCAHCCLEKD